MRNRVAPLPLDAPAQPDRTGIARWTDFECSSFAGASSLDGRREINRFLSLQKLVEVRVTPGGQRLSPFSTASRAPMLQATALSHAPPPIPYAQNPPKKFSSVSAFIGHIVHPIMNVVFVCLAFAKQLKSPVDKLAHPGDWGTANLQCVCATAWPSPPGASRTSYPLTTTLSLTRLPSLHPTPQ